ncbi:putative small metal-binding protein [Pontibacter aydingkolensis]|uniref:DUF1059 domain-containing protein n=1 Tax=Pontibacter aydingkolensis TaxID=1911536 RepID=A0ABS7D0A8_9BACT|nr:DUF1059 domain-containing protein [Pontibacter aydingkolensis]MBW7469167.1 DUF1059 domain-containing protein [Pontibacter aydingkolensis]
MKTLKCRDVGFDCNGDVKARTEQEVLQQAAKDAHEVHGVTVTPQMAEQIKTRIKDDGVN